MEHHDEDYKDRAVTMGTLQMWIPIGLTVVGLTVVLITTVGTASLNSATRLTKLETLAEQRTAESLEMKQELRRLTETIQAQGSQCNLDRAYSNGESKQVR